MKNGIVGVILNILLSLIFSRFFGVFGIALATSLSIAFVSIMMCCSIKKYIGIYPLNKIFWISLIKALASMGIMILFGFFLKGNIDHLNYIVRMFCVAFFMLFVYLIGLIVMKHGAVKQVWVLLKQKC